MEGRRGNMGKKREGREGDMEGQKEREGTSYCIH